MFSSDFVSTLTAIDVYNSSGVKIAWNEDGASGKVNDSSVCSNMLQRGEKWLFSVVLVNVTAIHSGRYICQINYGLLKERNITKQLKVIDKVFVVKQNRCILGEPLSITCNVAGRLEGLNYRWKLNGTDLISTGRIYANSSTLLFERVLTVDKSGSLACEVCKEDSCCISSGTLNLDPYYGPYNVVLSVKEVHIYLNENETITVKCSSDCNPVCGFWWEGYVDSDSEELIISSFDPTMAGQYICNARNVETGANAKSETIFLHHAKVVSTIAARTDTSEVPQLGLLELGLVTIAVFLAIVGSLLFVVLRRTGKSIRDGSPTLHQPRAQQVSNEAGKEFLGFKTQNRPPIPIPQMQDILCRSYMGQNYLDIHGKSKSLQKLSYNTQSFSNPIRKSLSLQGLIKLPQMLWRQANGDASVENIRSFKSKNWSSMEGTAKFWKDKKDNNDAIPLSEAPSLSNNPHTRFEVNTPEDLYSSIDEDALSFKVYTQAKIHEENVQEINMNAATGKYDYDYAILPARQNNVTIDASETRAILFAQGYGPCGVNIDCATSEASILPSDTN